MSVREKIIQLSDPILADLLEYRKSHPGFRFWVRGGRITSTGVGEGINKGQLFMGSRRIFLSFHGASAHVKMTRRIGWVLELDENLNPIFHISISWPKEKDQKKINLYLDIIEKLGGFEKLDEQKYRKVLPNEDVFQSLRRFLDNTLPQINAIIKKHGLTDVFTIPEEKFQKRLDKILKQLPPMKKNDLFLNTILYGPPGTGKTYTMQQMCNKFIVTKNVQSREEYLEELIRNLTWWETVTASMMVLKKTTVPELEKHEFLKIKSKQSGTKNAKQIIWGSLQVHTDPIYPNVQVARRVEPFIFKKEDNSVWTILEDSVSKEVPEVITFLENVENFKPTEKTIQKNFRMVTFHQSFSYEDFVEGIKPVFDKYVSEELEYEIARGVFYESCNDAAKLAGYDNLDGCLNDSKEERKRKFEEATPYAIFIDEINRANISAVFGELITLIEEDKRLGKENEITDTTLPYSKTKFGVPANLYLVGTMNTADRSIEALDTALRRRFAFEEMMANSSVLNNYYLLKQLWIKYKHTYDGDEKWETAESKFADLVGMHFTNKKKYIDLKPESDNIDEELSEIQPDDFREAVEFKNGVNLEDLLAKINERLTALLSRDHTIGHAWLMNVFCQEDLQKAFSNKILPLLKEFFYNDYAKIGLVLGKNFVEAKKVGQKMFAAFDEGNELASDYSDKIIYTLKDPFELGLEDFKSIYQ